MANVEQMGDIWDEHLKDPYERFDAEWGRENAVLIARETWKVEWGKY